MTRHFFVTLVLLLLTVTVDPTAFTAKPPFFAQKYADVQEPRGLLLDELGDVLVLSRTPAIIALYETDNGDGTIQVEQTIIVDAKGLALTHGIAYADGYLYASSSTTVYRWPYTPRQRKLITVDPQVVIYGMPSGGGWHITRSLTFDSQSNLFVSSGSFSNIEESVNRARVIRFPRISTLPPGGIPYSAGTVYAYGLRNAVGLDFDSTGVLWAVENSGDNLERPDLGGREIRNENPADELNKLNPVNQNFGYPYCFSSFNVKNHNKGEQFVWPTFMSDKIHTDDWCRAEANNAKPRVALPAHNAPLGLHFFKGDGCGSLNDSFPCSSVGDAVIAYHGSTSSDTKVGYRVAWLPFNHTTMEPLEGGGGQEVNIINEENLGTCSPCFRPVSAIFNKKGHLIISTDASHEIFRVTYNKPPSDIVKNGGGVPVQMTMYYLMLFVSLLVAGNLNLF